MQTKRKRLSTVTGILGAALLLTGAVFGIRASAQTGGEIIGSTGPRFFTVPSSAPTATTSKAVLYGKTVNAKTELAAKTADGEVVLTTGGAIKETDPLSIHSGTDVIKDSMIDWGSAAGQVDADDIPASNTKAIPTIVDVAAGVSANGWGDHSQAGYIKTWTETDPLSVHTESDPVFSALYSAGVLTVGANGTDGGLKLYSEQGGTDHFVAFQPHAAMTQDVTYTLPADDGDADGLLMTSGAGALSWTNRIKGTQGVDVTAANDITLGQGNYFDITGATEVQRILATGWSAGSVVILQFDSNPLVKNATAAGTGYFGFKLAGAVDFQATADDTLTVVFDGAWWREVSRSAN